MPEYIEREAAVKVAEKYGLANGSALGRHTGLADCIASEIADIPTADVAPVVHGRWVFGKDLPYSWGQIPKNKYHLYCSECLEQAFNRSEDNDPDFDVDTSYCPNCGAKMAELKRCPECGARMDLEEEK